MGGFLKPNPPPSETSMITTSTQHSFSSQQNQSNRGSVPRKRDNLLVKNNIISILGLSFWLAWNTFNIIDI